MSEILNVSGLHAGYGAGDVLVDISVSVSGGEAVAILGANGAGKTTLLRSISGLLKSRGEVVFLGQSLSGRPPYKRARAGLAHVPQGRGTLSHLTVAENLWAGAHASGRERKEIIAHWFDVFPRLGERRNQMAGSLSGGEQQLLAVARAMAGNPQLVLLDEPSLGLAPLMVKSVFAELKRINSEFGTALLIVEQNATASLSIADRAYVLEAGRVTVEGAAADLAANDHVRRAYLGI
ncbi:ABC transporter ATP-binding protein [Microbacterium sp. CPCC 204701]|uniref:ABC transporter ATP-binding protein n=1 Tax=Microbacterium sp. CPCC 204701 TaxID=2493084 RepID=UPI000FD87962|nr:ABC transporter ATP-binding protein [Microbacterium sp. CPCC 204701]